MIKVFWCLPVYLILSIFSLHPLGYKFFLGWPPSFSLVFLPIEFYESFYIEEKFFEKMSKIWTETEELSRYFIYLFCISHSTSRLKYESEYSDDVL